MVVGVFPQRDGARSAFTIKLDFPVEASIRSILPVCDEVVVNVGRSEDETLELVRRTVKAGMTTEEFARIVKDWIATARHPVSKRPYTEMVYQPMLELLAYLRVNGFKTIIISGGGVQSGHSALRVMLSNPCHWNPSRPTPMP